MIKKLQLKNFGPFKNYEIDFSEDEKICLLLTGKNNQGKSSIISGLKLLDSATKVIRKKKQEIYINKQRVFSLLKQDTENFLLGRLIYNYQDDVIAEVRGVFSDNFSITVFVNPEDNLIYCDYDGKIPNEVENFFGFIPPLGALSEDEEIISNLGHLKASLNTSLAPRHLRNHFFHYLSQEEFNLVKEIVNTSWEDIELLDYERKMFSNKIFCYYKEKNFEREIGWAGQGQQIWLQIITHLVRLRDTSILILDEPEVNLHPQKQNELINILREYYSGTIIIATHSVELMNNVNISHIIHVNKSQRKPTLKLATDKDFLEYVRHQIGSNFNFVASQFEDVDVIIFTEDIDDFAIIDKLKNLFGFSKKAFNIPIHGFSEYDKCHHYKNAYKKLIGKDVRYSLLLDKDYYPENHLDKVHTYAKTHNINLIFTPGKEIENLFIETDLLCQIIPPEKKTLMLSFLDKIYTSLYNDCLGNFIHSHEHYLSRHPKKLALNTIMSIYKPKFDAIWNDKKKRHYLVSGKKALSKIRVDFKEELTMNLPTSMLCKALYKFKPDETKKIIKNLFQIN